MTRKNLLRTFIIGPLVSLSLLTAFASAAHAQDYDDDGPRVLTRAEVMGAYAKFERMQDTIRTYATVGIDAEKLFYAPNIFDIAPGERPDEVELIKLSDPAKASDPNAHYEILRILDREDFQSFEDWDVTVRKGTDGQVHRIARLNVKESQFGNVSYASLLQTNVRSLVAAYNTGKLAPITEDDVLVSMSAFYINDLTKPVITGSGFAHVVAKGVTVDERGVATLRAASIDYYGKSCTSPAVTGSNFGQNSTFAHNARPYSFTCKYGLIASDGANGVSVWYPGETQAGTTAARPGQPASHNGPASNSIP